MTTVLGLTDSQPIITTSLTTQRAEYLSHLLTLHKSLDSDDDFRSDYVVETSVNITLNDLLRTTLTREILLHLVIMLGVFLTSR